MGWLRSIFGSGQAERAVILAEVQLKYSMFRDLLDRHNQVLKDISRLEQNQQQNKRLAGIAALWDDFVQIREGTSEIIEGMIRLGGGAYLPLRERLEAIGREVERALPQGTPVSRDSYIIAFDELGRTRAASVGAKNANLGEMRSRIGLPVPNGFAISAWAYKHFIDTHELQDRIHRLLSRVRIQKYVDLEIISEEIRELVNSRAVPDDLAEAIFTAFDALARQSRARGFALRSSAVGEDTSFTFAGQYRSFLNVRRDDLLDRYKEILASVFTPSAIYYLLSHSLSEMDIGMGVVCMELVDAAAAGVVYTRDPANPAGDYVMVNSVFGLGGYLVEGVLTPDVFHVGRSDGAVALSRVVPKAVRLTLAEEGGLIEAVVAECEQERASLTSEQLRRLSEYALRIEEHFGEPQDIEWALDHSGVLYVLQARPLQLPKARTEVRIPAQARADVLLDGGTPVCGGVGTGPLFHLTSIQDLDKVPPGSVLVTQNPSPRLVMVMHKISALVTMVGGNASHLATLAREMALPTVVGLPRAAELATGREVTVDASHGTIYDGSHPEWIATSDAPEIVADAEIEAAVRNMLAPIIRLNAIHPSDPDFTPQNCRTFHDVARFIHQKSMEEMFATLKRTSRKDDIGLRLKTKIPLVINIIYLDRENLGALGKRWVSEEAIEAPPMTAFWQGILEEGWPQTAVPADLKGFLAVVGSNLQEGHQPEFSENSYAFLSREYMLLNLRMGYHFSTFEAYASSEPDKNYIRMQFKLGGAPLERRIRRIWIISELLRLMNFETMSQGDFLDASIAYQTEGDVYSRLTRLGRITILTKQLDMTLSSDARARWYLDDFVARLGLRKDGG